MVKSMDEILTKIATILDTQYQDKIVDEEFLQAIFDDVVKEQGLEEYLENGLLMNEESPMFFAVAAYCEKEKNIKFFDTAIRDTKYEVNMDIKTLPESKKVFATNLLLVTSLLYELEHAHQKKLVETSDSYEAELLRMAEGRQETISTYNLIPNERFAESKALQAAMTILDRTGLIVPDLRDYLDKKRANCLIGGYEGIYDREQTYPIKQYAEKHEIPYSEMSVEESVQTEPDLETRLFYGMPITKEEYQATRAKAGLKNSGGSYTV